MTISCDRLPSPPPLIAPERPLARPGGIRHEASRARWRSVLSACPALVQALLVLAIVLFAAPLGAATSTWVAAGVPTDSDFSYDLNWDAVPSPGGDVVFAAGSAFAAKPSPVNDLTAMSINDINIYAAYDISGNAVTCSGVNDNSATTATISMPLGTPGTAVMTITVTSAGGVLYLPGILSGAGPVTYGGPGNTVLSNAGNTASGLTTLGQGTLHIWGSLAASPIMVTMGTLVLANGCTVGNLTLSGSSSILSCNETLAAESMQGTCGALTFGSSSEFLVVTAGAGAAQYTNVAASSATLTSGILVVNTAAYEPAASSVMTIIHNAGGAVTGTFAGLAEGATVTSSTNVGTTFTISYLGGAGGHDVTLTAGAGNGAGTAGGTTTATGTATGTATTTATGSATGSATGTATAAAPAASSGSSSSKCGFGGGAIGLLLVTGLIALRRKT